MDLNKIQDRADLVMELAKDLRKLDNQVIAVQDLFKKFDVKRQYRLGLETKLVFLCGDRVYKFCKIPEGVMLYLIPKYFQEKFGINVFLPSVVEDIFMNIGEILISQPKVEVATDFKRKDLVELFMTEVWPLNLIEDYGLMWYEDDNSGYLNGDIRIFDYVMDSTGMIQDEKYKLFIKSGKIPVYEEKVRI